MRAGARPSRKERGMAQQAFGGQIAAPVDVHVTGRRVLATIVDGVVLALIFTLFSAMFGTTTAGGGEVGASVSGVAALVMFVLSFGYYIVMEGYLGQTVGKMLLGIKVVRKATR